MADFYPKPAVFQIYSKVGGCFVEGRKNKCLYSNHELWNERSIVLYSKYLKNEQVFSRKTKDNVLVITPSNVET